VGRIDALTAPLTDIPVVSPRELGRRPHCEAISGRRVVPSSSAGKATRAGPLARDFVQQHLVNQTLPPERKRPFTVLIGMRSWFFAAFQDLKRHPDA
jgi:hypothetical protein